MSSEIRDYAEFFGFKNPITKTASAIKKSITDVGICASEERALTAACIVLALRNTKYSFLRTNEIARYAGITGVHLKTAVDLVEKRVKKEGVDDADIMG